MEIDKRWRPKANRTVLGPQFLFRNGLCTYLYILNPRQPHKTQVTLRAKSIASGERKQICLIWFAIFCTPTTMAEQLIARGWKLVAFGSNSQTNTDGLSWSFTIKGWIWKRGEVPLRGNWIDAILQICYYRRNGISLRWANTTYTHPVT